MTKQNAIQKVVLAVVKELSQRNRDIVSRRFGLKNGKKETLESIGKSYGITRERVRQIEESTLANLAKSTSSNSEVQKYVSLSKDILKENGGVLSEDALFSAFSGSTNNNVVNASLAFLLRLDSDLVRVQENDNFKTFWAADKVHLTSFKNTISTMTQVLNKKGEVLHENDFFSLLHENNTTGFEGEPLNEKHLEVCLAVSRDLGKNIFSEVGLASWPEVKPKGVKDKAYLVLKKNKEPKHFSNIAKLINSVGFGGKKANVQTVHNELIKDNRFVLVGRGMYALSEWGYKAGTVKEVLVSILKDKPLVKSAILAKVMDARMVKENTVLLNLQDSKTFVKNQDGTYQLRKA
jgi:hypothetical protein